MLYKQTFAAEAKLPCRERSMICDVLTQQDSAVDTSCTLHSGVRRKFSWGEFWFRVIWWSFGVRCLWRHNLTSFPCFQANVLAKFV